MQTKSKNFSTIIINLLIIIICLALHIKFSTPLLADVGDPEDADVSDSASHSAPDSVSGSASPLAQEGYPQEADASADPSEVPLAVWPEPEVPHEAADDLRSRSNAVVELGNSLRSQPGMSQADIDVIIDIQEDAKSSLSVLRDPKPDADPRGMVGYVDGLLADLNTMNDTTVTNPQPQGVINTNPLNQDIANTENTDASTSTMIDSNDSRQSNSQ